MVERELPKLVMRVRFPSPAPIKRQPLWLFFYWTQYGGKRSRRSGFDYQRKAGERTPVAKGNERQCGRVFSIKKRGHSRRLLQ